MSIQEFCDTLHTHLYETVDGIRTWDVKFNPTREIPTITYTTPAKPRHTGENTEYRIVIELIGTTIGVYALYRCRPNAPPYPPHIHPIYVDLANPNSITELERIIRAYAIHATSHT